MSHSAEYVAALERDVAKLREQVYMWKALSRKHEQRARENKANLDALRAAIAESAGNMGTDAVGKPSGAPNSPG